MDDTQEKNGTGKGADLPDWMIQLSRAIVRDCVAAGSYRIDLTIESHNKRIKTAVISRVENIRCISTGGN